MPLTVGGCLGSPSYTPPPPTHQGILFCLILLNYMTSGVYSGCQLSLLKQHIFLILTQPSWDGYLLLYSPKSSIRGTDITLVWCGSGSCNLLKWGSGSSSGHCHRRMEAKFFTVLLFFFSKFQLFISFIQYLIKDNLLKFYGIPYKRGYKNIFETLVIIVSVKISDNSHGIRISVALMRIRIPDMPSK